MRVDWGSSEQKALDGRQGGVVKLLNKVLKGVARSDGGGYAVSSFAISEGKAARLAVFPNYVEIESPDVKLTAMRHGAGASVQRLVHVRGDVSDVDGLLDDFLRADFKNRVFLNIAHNGQGQVASLVQGIGSYLDKGAFSGLDSERVGQDALLRHVFDDKAGGSCSMDYDAGKQEILISPEGGGVDSSFALVFSKADNGEYSYSSHGSVSAERQVRILSQVFEILEHGHQGRSNQERLPAHGRVSDNVQGLHYEH